jgi:hypothetical protein
MELQYSGRPVYLVQFTYTNSAWQRMMDAPTTANREGPVKAVLQEFHGCLGKISFPDCKWSGDTVFEKGLLEGRRQVVALILFENKLYAEAFGVYLAGVGDVQDLVMYPLTTMLEMAAAVKGAGEVKANKNLKYQRP